MAIIGQPDLKATAVNLARDRLDAAIQRIPEPSFDLRELGYAIDGFISAKIAYESDKRY